MSTPNDGGPAFPVPPERINNVNGDNHWAYASGGMTLRDYFAAAALQGYLAAGNAWSWRECRGTTFEASVSIECYAMADAMLAASWKGRA